MVVGADISLSETAHAKHRVDKGQASHTLLAPDLRTQEMAPTQRPLRLLRLYPKLTAFQTEELPAFGAVNVGRRGREVGALKDPRDLVSLEKRIPGDLARGSPLPLRTTDAIGVPTVLKPQPWQLRPRVEKGVLSRTQN